LWRDQPVQSSDVSRSSVICVAGRPAHIQLEHVIITTTVLFIVVQIQESVSSNNAVLKVSLV